jgi:hypothetical protein
LAPSAYFLISSLGLQPLHGGFQRSQTLFLLFNHPSLRGNPGLFPDLGSQALMCFFSY